MNMILSTLEQSLLGIALLYTLASTSSSTTSCSFTCMALSTINIKSSSSSSSSSSGSKFLPIEDRILSAASSTPAPIEACVKRAQKEHETQYQSGLEVFGCSTSTSTTSWPDEKFNTYAVEKGYAGPSESVLQNGNIIYQTKEPVLTNEDCLHFIDAAKETIELMRSASSSSSSTERSNSDLNEARLSQLPKQTLDKLRSLLQSQLYPLLESKFGTEEESLELTLYDGLVLGHVGPSISQPVHRDASLLTLNIPLSSLGEDYEYGGGTYIEGLGNANNDSHDNKNSNNSNKGLPLIIEKGKSICHSSGIMHAGVGIGKGQRWVMVLFLIAKHEPQIARRCHAEGLFALQSQSQDPTEKLNNAIDAFETGLYYAPHDHLLHMGIGQIASQLATTRSSSISNDNEKENAAAAVAAMDQVSFDCLAKSATYYPPAYKSAIAMGKMLLMKRKPRAALRRFDQVLSMIDNIDLEAGVFLPIKALAWDTRVHAARCAVLCADYSISKQLQQQQKESAIIEGQGEISVDHDNKGYEFGSSWSNKLRLEEAIERLQIAMIPVPHDEQLQALMKRARELLLYSN